VPTVTGLDTDYLEDQLGQAIRPDRKRAFRVGIMGASFQNGNRGVSALGASLASLIWQSRPDATVSLLIGNRDGRRTELHVNGSIKVVETVNYRLSPRAALGQQLWWILVMSSLYRLIPWARSRKWIINHSEWIRAIVEADFVGDIRGGDSFSDIYGAKDFCLGSLPVLSVILIRGGIHLLPQTYGPFSSAPARRLARYILLRAQSIWCRDRVSLDEVSRLTGGRRQGVQCPDVAFALASNRPNSPAIDPPLHVGDSATLIGLNVSGILYNEGSTWSNIFGLRLDYRTFVKRLAQQLLLDESNRIMLVPHTFAPEGTAQSDPAACRDLMRQLPPTLRSRVHLVTAEYDQHEIKGIIGMCDFFIGARMHACIAALSQGIPTVAVAYSRKFAGVFETVGAENWVIDGRTQSVQEALDRALELFSQRIANRNILPTKNARAQHDLISVFKQIVGESRLSAMPRIDV
jgi:colanic acid/amylovoran biosynthesis protein